MAQGDKLESCCARSASTDSQFTEPGRARAHHVYTRTASGFPADERTTNSGATSHAEELQRARPPAKQPHHLPPPGPGPNTTNRPPHGQRAQRANVKTYLEEGGRLLRSTGFARLRALTGRLPPVRRPEFGSNVDNDARRRASLHGRHVHALGDALAVGRHSSAPASPAPAEITFNSWLTCEDRDTAGGPSAHLRDSTQPPVTTRDAGQWGGRTSTCTSSTLPWAVPPRSQCGSLSRQRPRREAGRTAFRRHASLRPRDDPAGEAFRVLLFTRRLHRPDAAAAGAARFRGHLRPPTTRASAASARSRSGSRVLAGHVPGGSNIKFRPAPPTRRRPPAHGPSPGLKVIGTPVDVGRAVWAATDCPATPTSSTGT